jgi:hypothetical protein
MKFFAEYRARKAAKRAEENAKAERVYEERKAKHQSEVDSATLQMLSRPCPIAEGKNCFKECVHFQAGCVKKYLMYGDAGYRSYSEPKFPKCKLWCKGE